MKFTTFLLPFLMMVPAGASQCDVDYYVYPSGVYVPGAGTGPLSDYGTISDIPCLANIEARVSGCTVSGSVEIKLFKNKSFLASGTESKDPRFLYGDLVWKGGDVFKGSIPGNGDYFIKTKVNGLWIGKLHFTISGNCDGVPDPSCTVTYEMWSSDDPPSLIQNLSTHPATNNPPCKANIEAVLDCSVDKIPRPVTIELLAYNDKSIRLSDRGEREYPYFLYGNDYNEGTGAVNVYDGEIPAPDHRYYLRTIVDGIGVADPEYTAFFFGKTCSS